VHKCWDGRHGRNCAARRGTLQSIDVAQHHQKTREIDWKPHQIINAPTGPLA
jgi:hypothetical protein